nr:hypothetical protein [Caldilineaceae bacterium]
RFFNGGSGADNGRSDWGVTTWLHLAVVLVAPAMLCGSTTAVAVWMADEGVSPATLIAYWRYGVYPILGGGYQSGAKYSAVWGMPCSGVGTLGQSCSVEEIVADGLEWQNEISLVSGAAPVPVVVPRLSRRFGLVDVRGLLTTMHQHEGLVIVDTGEDFDLAHRAIDELTAYGLDGVAIDLEYV